MGKQRKWTGTLESSEKSEFLALVDLGFGCGPGSSMRQVCPAALADANLDHCFATRVDGRIVATAVAIRRPWVCSLGVVDIAVLGCFATHPDWRGRGLSRELQHHVLSQMRHEGATLALLWAENPDIYRRRGFRECGRELHVELTGLRQGPRPVGRLRRATLEDIPALDALYRAHRYHCHRREEDWAEFLSPGVSEVVVEDGGGLLRAYAALGKGMDFPGYVHEFGGEVDAVHRIWSSMRSLGARHVLVPASAEAYLQGAAESCPRREQPSAMGAALTPDLDAKALDDFEFAAWGFDSA